MAIKKIGILQSTSSGAAWSQYDLGATTDNVVLSNIVSTPSIASTLAFNDVRVVSSDTDTAAWNNFNKLCTVATNVQTALTTDITAVDSRVTALSGIVTNLSTATNSSFTTIISSVNDRVSAALPRTYSFTINSASWANSEYTKSNSFFISSGYVYWVSPRGFNYEGVYADNVTSAGKIKMHCLTNPTENVIIDVIRMEAGT